MSNKSGGGQSKMVWPCHRDSGSTFSPTFYFQGHLLDQDGCWSCLIPGSIKEEGTKSGSLLFKATSCKSHGAVLLTSYWLWLNHMIKPCCKGVWEMCPAKSKDLFLRSKGRMDAGGGNHRLWPQSRYSGVHEELSLRFPQLSIISVASQDGTATSLCECV